MFGIVKLVDLHKWPKYAKVMSVTGLTASFFASIGPVG